MSRIYLCRCRSPWCWLDSLLFCRSQFVCNRHDDFITKE